MKLFRNLGIVYKLGAILGLVLFGFVLVGQFGRELLPEASRAVAKKKKLDEVLKRREEVCRILKTEERHLFPLQYRLRLPVAGEQKPRSGKVY